MASTRAYVLSHQSVFLVFGIIAGIWLAFQLRFLLILLFLALIVTLGLRPLLDQLTKRGLGRRPAALLLILLFLAILIGVVTYFVPQVITQVAVFVNDLPDNLVRLSETTGIRLPHQADAINQALGSSVQTAIAVTTTTLGVIFSIFAVATIGYYGLADYDKLWRWVGGLPGVRKKQVRAVEANLEKRLGGWVRGQLILSTIIGILDLALFLAFGLPFAALLAVLGAGLAVIPVVGPVVAGVPAVLIALTISPGRALGVGLVYLVLQLVVAYILTPKILGKSSGLHPVSIIIALTAGAALGGIVGALLAVPVFLFLVAIYEGVTRQDAPLTE